MYGEMKPSYDDSQLEYATRKPIYIFRLIRKSNNEEVKAKFVQLLEKLKKKIPNVYKIGAAVNGDDSFLDCIAQGLNELTNDDFHCSQEIFNINSMKEKYKQFVKSNVDKKSKIKNKNLEAIENTFEDSNIWNEIETVGDAIGQIYGIKIKIITVKEEDEEITSSVINRSKAGKGKIIYIVNYRNHFVPLLVNIDQDIKKKVQIPVNNIYGNCFNSSHASQIHANGLLSKTENCDKKPAKRASSEEVLEIIKKPRLDSHHTDEECKEIACINNSPADVMNSTFATMQNIPLHLINLMYRLDLSILYSLRKCIYTNKYPSLTITFEDFKMKSFDDIHIKLDDKFIHIQMEILDKFYGNDEITVGQLLGKTSNFSIFRYLKNLIKYLESNTENPLGNIHYFLIYTNAKLNINKNFELNANRIKSLKFTKVNSKYFTVFKDFFLVDDNGRRSECYQFSHDSVTRTELLKALESYTKVSLDIKEKFLDRLLFIANQPNRDELNHIIRHEIKKVPNNNYNTLQRKLLNDFKTSRGTQKSEFIYQIFYELDLLTILIHNMFLYKNVSCINFEEKSSNGTQNYITILHKRKIICIRTHRCSIISFKRLFSAKKSEKDSCLLNDFFSFFVNELDDNIKYLIIYSNGKLFMTEDNRLKISSSDEFYPFELEKINLSKNKYKIFKDCSYLDELHIYQFTQEQEGREKLFNLLKLPPTLQKEKDEGKLSEDAERGIKEKFINKLLLAVNQPNEENLNIIIRDQILSDNVPYDFETLHEVTLRWLESHEFGSINVSVINQILREIVNNKLSHHEYSETDLKIRQSRMKLAKSIVGKVDLPSYNHFLDFIIRGEGAKYLENLKGAQIKQLILTRTLKGIGTHAIKVFKDFYYLWYDKNGNKTDYLYNLQKEEISVPKVLGMLTHSGSEVVSAFKELYQCWFDEHGNKNSYLETLIREKINIGDICSILSEAGAQASKSFKKFYHLLVDNQGNRTIYLKTLQEEGLSMTDIAVILNKSGLNAPKAFKRLCKCWFDKNGNRSAMFITLKKEGMNLKSVSKILTGSGENAAKIFCNLYQTWFDNDGNKVEKLINLENKGIDLPKLSSALNKSGLNAVRVFEEFYNFGFLEDGTETQELRNLESNHISLKDVCKVLEGSGSNAADVSVCKKLHALWFDGDVKSAYLKNLENQGVHLKSIVQILEGAGSNAPKAFKSFYQTLFNLDDTETLFLNILKKENINLVEIFSIIHGTGINNSKCLQEIYNSWFEKNGTMKTNLAHFVKNEKEKRNFTISDLSIIFERTGTGFREAFLKFYTICFQEDGRRTIFLNHLYKAGFKPRHLSSILARSGVYASSNVGILYRFCFNQDDTKTKAFTNLLNAGCKPSDLCKILFAAVDVIDSFYVFCRSEATKRYWRDFLEDEKSFAPSDLCEILQGAGNEVCSALQDFHNVCYDQDGQRTRVLNNFYRVGFTPNILRQILSKMGSKAASVLTTFHNYCFHKKYLKHFSDERELFSVENLSKILEGTGIDVCDIFQKLHNYCYDEQGVKKKFLIKLINKYSFNDRFNVLCTKIEKFKM